MTEVIIDYFKGFKNYFRTFNKSKFNRILKIITILLLLILFNLIAIPCFLFYKYGFYRAKKQFLDSLDKKTPTYLSGIHTTKENELVSISEVNIENKKRKF